MFVLVLFDHLLLLIVRNGYTKLQHKFVDSGHSSTFLEDKGKLALKLKTCLLNETDT